MQDNIEKFEKMNGKISAHDGALFPMSFGGPTDEAYRAFYLVITLSD